MQSALFVFTVAWISDKGYMYFRNMVIQKKKHFLNMKRKSKQTCLNLKSVLCWSCRERSFYI